MKKNRANSGIKTSLLGREAWFEICALQRLADTLDGVFQNNKITKEELEYRKQSYFCQQVSVSVENITAPFLLLPPELRG